MNKLKLHTPDLTAGNVERIAALFPNCVTEATDETGKLKRAIDFDLLKQELSADLVEGPQERYRLDWPGKRESLALANTPVALTLRPCREESVDFETTKNLYIEGDNLDALKLLQETYLGKVKMIYIDPPYNTGNDFIYDDNFTAAKEAYQLAAGERDDDGNRMIANTEANGRFHSDWLSMMYARIRLSRNVLEEGGVCLISCDDREEANLRKVCDEIFGEGNRLDRGTMIWKSACSPRGFNHVIKDHEFILAYARNIDLVDYDTADPSKEDEFFEGQLWIARTAANPVCRITFPAGIRCEGPDRTVRGSIGSGRTIIDIIGELKIESGKTAAPVMLEGSWPSKNQLIEFLSKRDNDEVYDTKGQKWVEVYLTASNFPIVSKVRGRMAIRSIIDDCGNTGTPDLKSLGLEYSHPKPKALIEKLVEQFSRRNSIVLDFFAGSSTTAESVMRINCNDGGERRFIMVQLPDTSEALSKEFNTLADVGKERIRRAGKKILAEWQAKQAKEKPAQGDLLAPSSDIPVPHSAPDIGFRVLKIDSSNFADIHRTPDALDQKELTLHTEHIKPERTPEDLLFQVLVDWGVDLALPITEEILDGKRVFFVDGSNDPASRPALAACFDTGLTDELIKAIAARQPMRAVFRDESYGDDSTRINVGQLFKLLSPNTEIKSL